MNDRIYYFDAFINVTKNLNTNKSTPDDKPIIRDKG